MPVTTTSQRPFTSQHSSAPCAHPRSTVRLANQAATPHVMFAHQPKADRRMARFDVSAQGRRGDDASVKRFSQAHEEVRDLKRDRLRRAVTSINQRPDDARRERDALRRAVARIDYCPYPHFKIPHAITKLAMRFDDSAATDAYRIMLLKICGDVAVEHHNAFADAAGCMGYNVEADEKIAFLTALSKVSPEEYLSVATAAATAAKGQRISTPFAPLGGGASSQSIFRAARLVPVVARASAHTRLEAAKMTQIMGARQNGDAPRASLFAWLVDNDILAQLTLKEALAKPWNDPLAMGRVAQELLVKGTLNVWVEHGLLDTVDACPEDASQQKIGTFDRASALDLLLGIEFESANLSDVCCRAKALGGQRFGTLDASSDLLNAIAACAKYSESDLTAVLSLLAGQSGPTRLFALRHGLSVHAIPSYLTALSSLHHSKVVDSPMTEGAYHCIAGLAQEDPVALMRRIDVARTLRINGIAALTPAFRAICNASDVQLEALVQRGKSGNIAAIEGDMARNQEVMALLNPGALQRVKNLAVSLWDRLRGVEAS